MLLVSRSEGRAASHGPRAWTGVSSPALILAPGERELAIEQFTTINNREPTDVLDVIQGLAMDAIRYDAMFQAEVEKLNIVDRHADRHCR